MVVGFMCFHYWMAVMKDYKIRLELSITELIAVVVGVIMLLSLYSLLRDNDESQLAYNYERIVEASQLKIEGMQGVMDCHFVGEEYPHTWRNACVLTTNGVEITR
tara:strand:- start:84 stop:398 length:315 start_codon:yes stop_codon:yes gene_type:complete